MIGGKAIFNNFALGFLIPCRGLRKLWLWHVVYAKVNQSGSAVKTADLFITLINLTVQK
jgi:hypothetical protein